MDDAITPVQPVAELSPEQQERRRRLIDAAFELGAEGGYEAVQMRSVSETANVAMATIYRYFSSKDHLLAAAMMEWTDRLRGRVAQSPPRGDTAADQMVDVLQRACRAMERQPKLAEALVRALSSADVGVRESGAEVSRHIAEMGNDILDGSARRGPRRHPRRARPRLVLDPRVVGQRPARLLLGDGRAGAGVPAC